MGICHLAATTTQHPCVQPVYMYGNCLNCSIETYGGYKSGSELLIIFQAISIIILLETMITSSSYNRLFASQLAYI